MSLATRITHDGVTFNVSARQAASLEILMETNGGGFATIKGYVSSKTGEVSNITAITRFSYENLNKRKKDFIEGVTMNDIMDEVRENAKIKALTVDDLYTEFDNRKADLLESINKTETGDRSDAHRQAHDRNYHQLTKGLKVNFVTEKVNGKQVPVLDADGVPTVSSILLSIIQVDKEIITPGTYKTVNSGVPVILSNAIEKKIPKTCKMKTLSLKDNNFESLKIAKQELLPSMFKGI